MWPNQNFKEVLVRNDVRIEHEFFVYEYAYSRNIKAWIKETFKRTKLDVLGMNLSRLKCPLYIRQVFDYTQGMKPHKRIECDDLEKGWVTMPKTHK